MAIGDHTPPQLHASCNAAPPRMSTIHVRLRTPISPNLILFGVQENNEVARYVTATLEVMVVVVTGVKDVIEVVTSNAKTPP